MKYTVPHTLIDDARKAKDWYDTTGMKVAKPPAMPAIVASWILLKCESDRPAGCTCEGHRHEGGVGGCYFGGLMVERCKCRWVDD